MAASSRSYRQSLGETERQPVFVTGSSRVDIDSKGGREASTSRPKEAERRKDDSKVSFQLVTLTVQLVTRSEARVGSSASSRVQHNVTVELCFHVAFQKRGLYQ